MMKNTLDDAQARLMMLIGIEIIWAVLMWPVENTVTSWTMAWGPASSNDSCIPLTPASFWIFSTFLQFFWSKCFIPHPPSYMHCARATLESGGGFITMFNQMFNHFNRKLRF